MSLSTSSCTISGATSDIEAIVKKIGTETCKLLQFVCAILGCDTTSRLHGLGKGIAFKRIRDNEQLRENATKFSRINVLKEKPKAVGEAALSVLYCGYLLAILIVNVTGYFSKK